MYKTIKKASIFLNCLQKADNNKQLLIIHQNNGDIP